MRIHGRIIMFFSVLLAYQAHAEISWNMVPRGSYSHVASDGNTVIALGKQYSFSEDGASWISNGHADSYFGSSVRDFMFKDGAFMAITEDGSIARSTDGNHWTRVLDKPTKAKHLVYARNKWRAFAKEDVYTSADGVEWEKSIRNTAIDFHDIGFFNDTFYGVSYGTLYSSKNGLSWARVKALKLLRNSSREQFVSGAGNLLVYGPSHAYISSDGKNWTVVTPQDSTSNKEDHPRLRTIIFDGTQFVGYASGDRFGYLLSSTNGRQWQHAKTTDNYEINAITLHNGHYIAAGRFGTIIELAPSGGESVYQRAPDLEPSIKLFASHHDGERFWVTTNSKIVYSSENGRVWEREKELPPKIIEAAGKFFRVNGSTVEVSEDKNTWSSSLAKTAFDIISPDGTTIFAGGKNGMIYTTTDGENWEPHVSGVSGEIHTLHYTNKRFFAETSIEVSNWSTLDIDTKKIADITSSDGIHWQEIDIKKSLHTRYHHITYNGTHFVSFFNGNEIYQSADGINWENVYMKDYFVKQIQMRAQAESEAHTVIAGDNARIYVVEKDSTPLYVWPWIGTTRAFGYGSGFHTLYSLAYGKGLWLAAGHDLIIGQEEGASNPASDGDTSDDNVPPTSVAGDGDENPISAEGQSGGGSLSLLLLLPFAMMRYKRLLGEHPLRQRAA